MLEKIKGWFGETKVAAILAVLPSNQYKIINNVMVKTAYGTSQIDHVIVSIYGIFVIETKNYKGWITGTENSEQWVKNMYGKKYSFRNPIKQNYGHVKSLSQTLNLPESMFIPIVVFSMNADLKITVSSRVVYTFRLIHEIQEVKEKKLEVSQLEKIVNQIKASNVVSREERKEHVANVQRNVQLNKSKVYAGICPRCGGTLVDRRGRYGVFKGCSNYPRCKYTSKV